MGLDRPLVPLGFGADTVYLNVYVTDADYQPVQKKLDPDLKLQLDAWKERAQEENEPALTSYVFDGTPLLMKDKGGTGFRWIMSNQALTLSINANSKMMLQARVRLSSEYLWKTRLLDLPDLGGAISAVHTFLVSIFGSLIFLQVAGVDLALDLMNFEVGTAETIMQSFVSRVQKHQPDYSDTVEETIEDDGLVSGPARLMYRWRRLTGVSFGVRDAQLQVVLYDKLHDIKFHATEKRWFYDLWLAMKDANGLPLWDGEAPVWRVEVRYRRQALHEMCQDGKFEGVESAWELEGHIPGLWSYAVGHAAGGEDGLPDGWLRYVIPSEDKNKARWPVHPDWQVVQDGYKLLFPELEETDYQRQQCEQQEEQREREELLQEVDAELEAYPLRGLKYSVPGIDLPLSAAGQPVPAHLQEEEDILASSLGMSQSSQPCPTGDDLFQPDARFDLRFYVRKRKREVAMERAVAASLGWASTVAAWRTKPDDDERGVEPDLSEIYHYLHVSSEQRLEETGRDFDKLIARKRKLYHIADGAAIA